MTTPLPPRHADPDLAAIVLALPALDGDALRACQAVDGNGRIGDISPVDAAAEVEARAKQGRTLPIIAIAPAATTNFHALAFDGLPVRQAQAAARLLAAQKSLGPVEDQHIAAGEPRAEDGAIPVASASAAQMARWIALGRAAGLDPDYIYPVAALLPLPDEGSYIAAPVAGEEVMRGRSTGFAADPALVEAIVGDAPVTRLGEADSAALIAAAAANPDAPVNLRSGAFRKRSHRMFDRTLVLRLALLVGLIALAGLAMSAIQIGKYRFAASRLDRDAVAAARTVLRGDVTIDNAEGQLDNRLEQIGGGSRAFSVPAAGLYAVLRGNAAVSITRLSYTGNGTLTADLAAPRIEDLNQLLIAIQQDGYKVSAVPRAGADGRAAANITVRAER